MKVIGYRDLRPVDWASGKRMPLEAGAGHRCDRCDREHAVVYEVLDDSTGKVYLVGSGCAKQQFGFDVGEDAGAKRLVKAAKAAEREELHAVRRTRVAEAAEVVLSELAHRLPVPEPTVQRRQPVLPDVVHVGDSVAWINFRGEAETVAVAVRGWYEQRIRDLTPPEWKDVLVAPVPGRRVTRSMASLLEATVMREIYRGK